MNNSMRYKEWLKDSLSEKDMRNIKNFEKFPRKLPTREIVTVYLSSKPIIDLCGEFRNI